MTINIFDAGDDFKAELQQQPIINDTDAVSPGTYVLEMIVPQIFLDESQVDDLVGAWLETAQSDPDFKGEITRAWFHLFTFPGYSTTVWIEVNIESGDLPAAAPTYSDGFFPVLAFLALSALLAAAAALVFATGVTVEPQGWRKVVATGGLILEPQNQALQDVLDEPTQEGLGSKVATALPFLATATIAYLIFK